MPPDLGAVIGQALQSPQGLAIATNSPERMRQALYREAKRLQVSLTISLVNNQVWIKERAQPAIAVGVVPYGAGGSDGA